MLAPPFLTTTNYSQRKKKRKQNTQAQANHTKWLEKNGYNKVAPKSKKIDDTDSYKKSTLPLSNAIGNGFKTGVMANLHKESPEVQKAIREKANRTAPAYSKGAYQYITPGANLSDLGKKK